MRRFILFRRKRRPKEMGRPEVARFLSSLAVRDHVSPSTQNQAFGALHFLYREVLQKPLKDLGPTKTGTVHAEVADCADQGGDAPVPCPARGNGVSDGDAALRRSAAGRSRRSAAG